MEKRNKAQARREIRRLTLICGIDRLQEVHPISDAHVGWILRNDPRFVYDLRKGRCPRAETTVIALMDIITLIIAMRPQPPEES